MDKMYEEPKVYAIGTVQALTAQDDQPDKCGGSGDQFAPQLLSPNFSTDCP